MLLTVVQVVMTKLLSLLIQLLLRHIYLIYATFGIMEKIGKYFYYYQNVVVFQGLMVIIVIHVK